MISRSVEETMRFAESFGKLLSPGDTVALIGELGSGKTVFTKGIARGLKVASPEYVNSPTFVIIKEHKGAIPLYHMDVYRLEGPRSIETVPYDDYFYGDGVTVVEWAGKISESLPEEHIRIELSHRGETTRKIIVTALGSRYKKLLRRMKK
ncbi:MAG: tRNA (adenosine(37)-N6)-threonylcarbamoyltransferase complex ATPase subunit type 1 TsaE [Candidatus Omnitrophota bacterium]